MVWLIAMPNDYKVTFQLQPLLAFLINPDYIKETTALAEKQKLMYKDAYLLYQQNNLKPAMDKVNEALGLR